MLTHNLKQGRVSRANQLGIYEISPDYASQANLNVIIPRRT